MRRLTLKINEMKAEISVFYKPSKLLSLRQSLYELRDVPCLELQTSPLLKEEVPPGEAAPPQGYYDREKERESAPRERVLK